MQRGILRWRFRWQISGSCDGSRADPEMGLSFRPGPPAWSAPYKKEVTCSPKNLGAHCTPEPIPWPVSSDDLGTARRPRSVREALDAGTGATGRSLGNRCYSTFVV